MSQTDTPIHEESNVKLADTSSHTSGEEDAAASRAFDKDFLFFPLALALDVPPVQERDIGLDSTSSESSTESDSENSLVHTPPTSSSSLSVETASEHLKRKREAKGHGDTDTWIDALPNSKEWGLFSFLIMLSDDEEEDSDSEVDSEGRRDSRESQGDDEQAPDALDAPSQSDEADSGDAEQPTRTDSHVRSSAEQSVELTI
ncbi:hypothetical protein C8F01DRAFT_1185004 [Mycena amicta]|nr:hypothetical protein C8F01DRAFT_1185004 [Mycena amicta]